MNGVGCLGRRVSCPGIAQVIPGSRSSLTCAPHACFRAVIFNRSKSWLSGGVGGDPQ